MDIATVIDMSRDLLTTTTLVALPALVVSLLAGLAVSIFQTVTSIQDQTLSSVPRLLLVGLVVVVSLGFSLDLAVDFARRMILRSAGVES